MPMVDSVDACTRVVGSITPSRSLSRGAPRS